MHSNSRWLVVVGLAFTMAIGPSLAGAQNVEWQPNLDAAKTKANESKKLVMVHFTASWCRPCQQLETFVFQAPAVARAVNQTVVPVKIDIDEFPALAKRFSVITVPTDVFMTPNEKVVQVRPSPSDTDAYQIMLGEIATASTTINSEGETNLDRIQQLQSQWHVSQEKPVDSMYIPPFDQQRPMGSKSVSPLLTNESQSAASGEPLTEATSTQQPSISGGAFEFPSAKGTKVVNPTMVEEKVDGVGQASVAVGSISNANANSIAQTSGADQVRIKNPFFDAALESQANIATATRASEIRTGVEIGNGAPESFPARIQSGQSGVAPTSGTAPKANFPLGLDGDCPVTLLLDGKWVKGDKKYGCIHRGKTYLFASAEYQQRFLQNPDALSPLLAGFDPVIYCETHEFVDGQKKNGIFMKRNGQQHVVLFSSDETQAKFRANPSEFLTAIRAALESADK